MLLVLRFLSIFLRLTKEVIPLLYFLKKVVFLKTLKAWLSIEASRDFEFVSKIPFRIEFKYDHLRTIR